MMVYIKRVYEPAARDDGTRILVDRLWPRGLSKQAAHIGLWLKDVAPSNELREWFGHDPAKWSEFKRRYRAELEQNQQAVNILLSHIKEGAATLVYGAKDEAHNQAVVLQEYLKSKNSAK